MDTRIYVMTHKKFTQPSDSLYRTLHVGRALGDDLGYEGDNTGDNISEKNKTYCELTGLYWVWKNVSCDVVGICHYRRYFMNDNAFITKDYIESVLNEYPVIVPRSSATEYGCVKDHYQDKHHIKDLLECGEVIKEKYPDYYDAFLLCINCNLFSLGNMVITRKDIYDRYCEWLFSILFEVEKRIDISTYDDYQKRVMGYLSERLFRVWLLANDYRIKEEEVKMMDPAEFVNERNSVLLKYKYVTLILNDLIRKYSNLNNEVYDEIPVKTQEYQSYCMPYDCDFNGKIPVWVCWFQGLDDAPQIVKMCIKSIDMNIPQDYAQVYLITFDNLAEYITLPEWIVEKYNAGKITMTMLSDIVRMGLLYRYGGMWIDSTYFVAKKLPDSLFKTDGFYTQKFGYPVFGTDVVQGRWACNLIKGPKEFVLFAFILEAFYDYFRKTDKAIDYYLIDYIAAVAYDNIPQVKMAIDSCKTGEYNMFKLREVINSKYNEENFKEMTKDTSFFKLSYKTDYTAATIVGDKTYYGKMCEMTDETV